MNLKAETDTGQMELFRRELDAKVKQALVAVASDAIVDMRRRVEAGRGLNDGNMKPYSKPYERWKASKGRDVSKRDLTFTGTMLGAIHVADVEKRGAAWVAVVTIGDSRSKQIAIYNQQRTPWFGWSPSNQKQIQASIRAQFKRIMGG